MAARREGGQEPEKSAGLQAGGAGLAGRTVCAKTTSWKVWGKAQPRGDPSRDGEATLFSPLRAAQAGSWVGGGDSRMRHLCLQQLRSLPASQQAARTCHSGTRPSSTHLLQISLDFL